MSFVDWMAIAFIGFFLWTMYKLIRWVFTRFIPGLTVNFLMVLRKIFGRNVTIDMDAWPKMTSTVIEKLQFNDEILGTEVLSKRKVFTTGRQYHHETTFMLHHVDGSQEARTVKDGTPTYDLYMSMLGRKKTDPQLRYAVCPSCGAPGRVAEGDTAPCAYCGVLLEAASNRD